MQQAQQMGYQYLEYNSPQWRAAYKPGRSQIEGANSVLESAAVRLADVLTRRGRGFGLHCLITAVKVVAANLDEIARFLKGGFDKPAPHAPKPHTGRPPKTTFADYAMSTDRPTYVVGEPTSRRRRRVA